MIKKIDEKKNKVSFFFVFSSKKRNVLHENSTKSYFAKTENNMYFKAFLTFLFPRTTF